MTPNDPISGVWPPPPTMAPPTGYGRPAFISGQGLARVIVPLLAVGIMLDVVEIPLFGAHAGTRRSVFALVSGADTILSLVMGICFLVWTHRAYRNLQAFGTPGLRWTPGWAVAYFFVPILSLYRPYQVIQEIWQASDTAPEARIGRDWQRIKAPRLLLGWWFSYIVANVLSSLSSLGGSNTLFLIAIEATMALSAALTILVVRQITARQDEAAQALLQTRPPESEPRSASGKASR